jgi:hypothetical protein
MATQLPVCLVGLRHHCQSVPANDRCDPFLHRQIAGIGGLIFQRDSILVQRIRMRRRRYAQVTRMLGQPLQQERNAVHACDTRHAFERVEPFSGFLTIGVLFQRHACRAQQFKRFRLHVIARFHRLPVIVRALCDAQSPWFVGPKRESLRATNANRATRRSIRAQTR